MLKYDKLKFDNLKLNFYTQKFCWKDKIFFLEIDQIVKVSN